jgi:predicted enzyme related to lactoylglutathione lyase
MHPQQPITNYVLVPSVDEAAAKVEKLGGKIMRPRTAVPEMGYFVICRDTENNEFALWEKSENAK